MPEIGAGGRRPAAHDIRDLQGRPRGVKVEQGGRTRRGAVILGFERATKVDAEGSTVRFEGVESSVATLTVSAYDTDVPLGIIAGNDVALLRKFDPMKPAGKAVMMIDVEIVPDESMEPLDAVAEKKATMAVNSTLGNMSPLKESP